LPALQVGAGILPLLQKGTVVWLKTEVPHTGNAVEGFCPGLLQPCAIKKDGINNERQRDRNNFIYIRRQS